MMFSTSNESFEQSDRRRVGKIVDTHREIDSSSNVSDRLSYTLNKTTSALTTELSLIIQCTPKKCIQTLNDYMPRSVRLDQNVIS